MKLRIFAGLTFGLLIRHLGAAPADPESSAPAAASERLSIDAVVSEVLSNNPSLKSARANWEAMKERVPQARAWADPRLDVSATAGRFVDVQPNSFPDYTVGAEQTIPIAGRNRWAGKAAEAEAATALGSLHRRQLDLVARARAAYYQLANAHEQLAINRRTADLLRQLVEVTRAKFEVGARPESDVLAAETELGKLDEARFDIERQISESETALNTLMNRPPQTPLARPADLVFSHPPDFSLERLHTMALDHRPELFIAREKIEAARDRVESAKRSRIPEPSFKVQASQYNQSARAIDEVDAGISFDLPFFNRAKYSAAIRESQKMFEGAQHDLAVEQSETLGRLRDHLRRVETFHHHAELFRDKVIPLAQQTVTATRRSYESDKADFTSVIEAERTLQDAQSMYWNHLADYLSALATLQATVGTDPNQPISQPPAQSKSGYYTCAMHPEVRSRNPDGKCPICQMPLLPLEDVIIKPGQ
jgi:cobalt-zinc-cadmium efflux system outer membrane protein